MPGRYYITRQAGDGPVSELFLALDATDKTGKGTEFHVQRFRAEYCGKEAFVHALEAEASAELGLSHPGILRLFDYGTWQGLCFLVYEKHTCLSLSEALAITRAVAETIDYLHVAGIAQQLLDALIYAHSVGEGKKHPVYQGGFSPECVELSSEGIVKVRGFARTATDAGSRPNFLDMAVGRMPYLAPALWAGQRATPYTDLYSLGALLWELLSGQPLPKSSGGDSAPPISTFRPDVPKEFAAFVAHLLEHSSDHSFASAADAKVALDKALFTMNAKVGKKNLGAWHKRLRKLDPKAGLKEDHGAASGERKVIAEVVASRKFKTFDDSVPEANLTPDETPTMQIQRPAPAGAANAWEKSVAFKEVPDTEPEETALKQQKQKSLIKKAAAALLALSLTAAGGFFYYQTELAGLPDIPDLKPSAPREILAVFAFQNAGTVIVQGARNERSKSFAHACGEVGRACFCDYLVAPDDAKPSSSVEGIYSPSYNVVKCPESQGKEKFVRVTSKDELGRSSNAVLIRSSLTWKHVLGPDHAKSRVRWVSQFSCDRTFLEGEAVGENAEVSCPPSQKLSLLSSLYHFYSYRSEEEGDISEPVPVATDSVCGNASISAYRCLDGSKHVLFGLYNREDPPFTTPISLTKSPIGDDTLAVFGFAAEPDSNGLCPGGLVKLKQWTATPPTVPGTTFHNEIGQLHDRVVEALEPKPLVLTRQSNRSPCDGKGNCSFATFEDPAPAQSTPYTAGSEICVFPSYFLGAAEGGDERGSGTIKEKGSEATIRIKTTMPGYEVHVNGRKAEVKNNAILVPVHQELKVEILKQGYLTQRFTVPPQDKTSEPYEIDAPAVVVVLGNVDLASFPPSTATFYLGDEKIFTGPTPVNEKLPVGKYKVKLVDKTGNENEISVTVTEGRTVSVDHLMKKK